MTKKSKVIITAGASGIGLETAKTFLKSGAQVAICDIDKNSLETVKASFPKIFTQVCDVSSAKDTQEFIENAARHLGGIDTPVSYTHLTLPTNREV